MAMSIEAEDAHSPAKRALFYALLVVVLLAFAELGAYAAGRFLQWRYKMYVTPVPQVSERIHGYADYLRLRDPHLGWPSRAEFGADFYDATGARRLPAFPDPARTPNAISIFGDSYAAGSEVDDEHSWGNVLARRAGARVGIYGVPGYGTDQAYLRYLDTPDTAKAVVLTHLSEDIARNLTRDWDLFTGMGYYALKPRFVLDAAGKLVEVPLPQLSESAYRHAVGIERPLVPMAQENFQPGGPAGVTALQFPFSLSVIRNLGSYQMRSLFQRRPNYAEFYDTGHPLQGVPITTAILAAFQAEARKRGQRPLVVLLATRHDLAYFRKTGTWTYATLAAALAAAGVDFVDFGPVLAGHVGERDVNAFFKPLGHYNEDVSELLARTVQSALDAPPAHS